MIFHLFEKELKRVGIDVNLIYDAYSQKHRFYHDISNLIHLVRIIGEDKSTDIDTKNTLFVIAAVHDVVYDTHQKTNEFDSAVWYKNHVNPEFFDEIVYNAVLDSANHQKEASSLVSGLFLKYDLDRLINGSLDDMIVDGHNIAREYGFLDWSFYSQERIKFVQNIVPFILKLNPKSQIVRYLDYVTTYKPKIAVYPGSFNPFHRGHLSILKKAEQIFDKVIIACGNNPDKSIQSQHNKILIEKLLPNNQVELFDGLLSTYLQILPYDVTVVKGLRNSNDFEYEKTQLRYINELDSTYKSVFIISDVEYETISSSVLRSIKKINDPNTSKILDKFSCYDSFE